MIRRCLSLTLLMLLSSTSYSQSLKITTIKNTSDQVIASEILKIIYHKLDISVTFVALPGKRALIESSNGELVDGEAQRIFEIGALYPTLIRVPTSYISWGASAFSKKRDFKITGWSSLSGYKVSMVRGMRYAEIGLKEAGVENVEIFDGSTQMMQYLNLNRADFAISSRFNGLIKLKELGIDSIYPLSPQLKYVDLYHYLHVKHKDLVPRVDEVIRMMKKSGELKQIQDQLVRAKLA